MSICSICHSMPLFPTFPRLYSDLLFKLPPTMKTTLACDTMSILSIFTSELRVSICSIQLPTFTKRTHLVTCRFSFVYRTREKVKKVL